MILEPKNDKNFLSQAHELARADAQHPVIRDFADKFVSLDEVQWFLRSLPFRLDLGNPSDGPRVPGNPSQRLRRLPPDLNCVEATVMYLTLAEVIDPETPRSSATLRMDRGYHTFPVERGRPVILDPILPRNAMAATIDYCTGRRIHAPVFWILDIAQHGNHPQLMRRGLAELTRAVLHRQPIRSRQDVDALLAIAREQAQLWGDLGRAAHDRASRQIRHFMALDQLLSEAR